MNGNSVICSNCNEYYDSYLERCPKCGAPNQNLNNSHVFNSNVLAPPTFIPQEEPVQAVAQVQVQEPVQEQRISLMAIANDPKAVLDPNNMPMVQNNPYVPEPIPTQVMDVAPEQIPLAVEEAEPQKISLTEIAENYKPANQNFLNVNEMPDLEVEAHVAKPDNVSLMDIAENYKPANSNMFGDNPPQEEIPEPEPVYDNNPYNEMQNQSLMGIANTYQPVNTDIFKVNGEPAPMVVPMGQGNASLTEIANNYSPSNNDIFRANTPNDVFNNPVNNSANYAQANLDAQIGVPPVSQSSVVTQEDINNLKEEEFTPIQKMKMILIILLVLAGLNFVFLFMSEFSILWFFIRVADVALAVVGYMFALKDDKKAGIMGIICGVRLVFSIAVFGIIDLLLGILTIVISLEYLKSKK